MNSESSREYTDHFGKYLSAQLQKGVGSLKSQKYTSVLHSTQV